MKLAAVPLAMATMLAALLIVAPVLVGCSTSQGTMTFADGTTYTGEFKDDESNGQGTKTFADGSTYTGQWKDGEANGLGTETLPDGTKRTGEWKDGKPVP